MSLVEWGAVAAIIVAVLVVGPVVFWTLAWLGIQPVRLFAGAAERRSRRVAEEWDEKHVPGGGS